MNRKGFQFWYVFTFLVAVKTYAQNPPIFFEPIRQDSVVLYFNKQFMFTEKDCYDYIRKTRVTKSGDFHGYFEDRGVDNKLLSKGFYVNGRKHGYFEIYYFNGNIYSRGYYQNNNPVGNWEYYYPNGILEQVLTIADSAVLMMRYIDPSGKVTVENGSGYFSGRVAGSMEYLDTPMFFRFVNGIPVMGKVVDGKPDGKWIIPDYNQQAYYTEKFDKGKIVKSSLVSKRKMKNNAHSLLNTFFRGNYLSSLETFQLESCSESQQYFFNNYADYRALSYDLRQKLDYIIYTDLHADRKGYYLLGDNFMSIQFTVDEKGKPYDIRLISDWGENFFTVVENLLKKTVFSNYSKTMYFHLKLSYANGNRYKYNFRFSKRERERQSG